MAIRTRKIISALKKTNLIFFLIVSFSINYLFSQTDVFKQNNKYGIKKNDTILVAPIYDTVFNFEPFGNVCLACFKNKIKNTNKFIKSNSYSLTCNYWNKKNQKLSIQTETNDTLTVFNFDGATVKDYFENREGFVVNSNKKKYLIDKNFKQLTLKGTYDVKFSVDNLFYKSYIMNENGEIFAGLIDRNEKIIIPYSYSNIKINPMDSLMIGCAAGIGSNYEDDIFNYDGKKINSFRRHIEMATKNFMIHKLYHPKEHFLIYNNTTKEEKDLKADEVYFFEKDVILIKTKNDWYEYDLNTHKKKSKQM